MTNSNKETSYEGKALREFKEAILALDSDEPHICIILHDNPDPDCIAGAMGLTKILRAWKPGGKVSFVYNGAISHAQNKTLVNVLNISLVHVSEIQNFAEYADEFVCIDATPERSLPKDSGVKQVLMTIDHHRNETNLSMIYDIRAVGAVCSIIWEYIESEGIELDKGSEYDTAIATALLVGIKTDTYDLVSENVTDLDFDAYKHLIGYVNRRHLSAIINYPIPAYHFDLRSKLDQDGNYKVKDGVFVGGIGYISPGKRDSLPMMAEERARVEGIETAIVFAVVGDHLEASVRSVGLSVDVNALCQKIFGKQYAGGKMGAGAAKIPMDFLDISNCTDDIQAKMWSSIKEFMIQKIFEVIG